MNHHYFIALPLPKEVKLFLDEKIGLFKKQFEFQKWVHMEDLHITLAFLGAADEVVLRECWKDCEVSLQDIPSFSLNLDEFGVFGRREQPRIFWSAPQPEERLMSLQETVANTCKKNGFSLDDRPFSPHITLARKYKGTNPFTKDDLVMCKGLLEDLAPFRIKEVALFQTRMDQEPKYAVKELLRLNESL